MGGHRHPLWDTTVLTKRSSPSFHTARRRPLLRGHYPVWWRHQMETFPRHWPFVRGIHRSPVNSPLKGQWHGALMFSLICACINRWVNNREADDLRRAHHDVIVTWSLSLSLQIPGNYGVCGVVVRPGYDATKTHALGKSLLLLFIIDVIVVITRILFCKLKKKKKNISCLSLWPVLVRSVCIIHS